MIYQINTPHFIDFEYQIKPYGTFYSSSDIEMINTVKIPQAINLGKAKGYVIKKEKLKEISSKGLIKLRPQDIKKGVIPFLEDRVKGLRLYKK